MAQGFRHEDAGRGRGRVLPVRRRLLQRGGGGTAAAVPADGTEAAVTVVEARARGWAGPAFGCRQRRRGCGGRLPRRWAAEGDQEEGISLECRGREGQETPARASI